MMDQNQLQKSAISNDRYNWEEYIKVSHEVAKKAIEYSKNSSKKIEDARKKNSNKYQLILKKIITETR